MRGDIMKKLLLKTGLLTIGSLSILSKDLTLNVEAKSPNIMISLEKYSKNSEEELVRKFANIYEINEDIVLSKLKELTGDFNNYNWNQNYGVYENKYENEELAILSTVRDISKKPEKYNLTKEELETNKEYETNEYYEDLLAHYSELLGVNKEIALSISYTECGSNLDSSNFLNNNNPAGLGPYNYYNNIEHGTIEYVFFLKNSCGCTKESDISFFYNLGPSYCPGGSDHWISMTTSFYSNISNDYYYYAYNRGYQKVLN